MYNSLLFERSMVFLQAEQKSISISSAHKNSAHLGEVRLRRTYVRTPACTAGLRCTTYGGGFKNIYKADRGGGVVRTELYVMTPVLPKTVRTSDTHDKQKV